MINLFYIGISGLANMLRGWGISGGKIYYSLFWALSVLWCEYLVTGPDWKHMTALFLYSFAMVLGAITDGWGKWVSAVLDGRINDMESEDRQFDEWIQGLEKRPVLWGMAGLTWRGFFWGTMVGAPLLSPWLPLAGLSMGLCFYIGSKLPVPDRWKAGECLLGLALGAALLQTYGLLF